MYNLRFTIISYTNNSVLGKFRKQEHWENRVQLDTCMRLKPLPWDHFILTYKHSTPRNMPYNLQLKAVSSTAYNKRT